MLAVDIRFSMDGRGRFLDNIFIERLWRSLKYEAVYLQGLRDGHAERIIGTCVDLYNEIRPTRRWAGGRRAKPPRWSGDVVRTLRRHAVPGAQPAQPRLRAGRSRRAPVSSAFPSGAGSDGKSEAGFKPGSGWRVRTARSGTVAVLGPTRSPRPQPRLRFPTMPTTDSGKPIADSGPSRSPWRRGGP